MEILVEEEGCTPERESEEVSSVPILHFISQHPSSKNAHN
jgi:hypothetical protein